MKAQHVLILLLTVFIMTAVASAKDRPADKIEEAYIEGRISYGQSLVYKVMSVRAPDNLPDEYKGDGDMYPAKSATVIMNEARRNLNLLSKTEQEELSNYLSRPNLAYSYDSPGGIFKIHYDISGSHAVATEDIDPANGIPDYIDNIAKYCDSAYNCMIVNLGYMVPPSDGTMGGDSLYDCYVIAMAYYGYTQAESEGPLEGDDWISYIAVHKDYIGFPSNDDPEGDELGAAKVTCAHEYFHAVQMAYNFLDDYWYMEASSTWMEEICYPLVNDNYYYLDNFLEDPHYSLYLLEGVHCYGAFIWNRFLDQYFDTLLIREIWEGLIDYEDAVTVINSSLTDRGSSLYEAYSEFAQWNWCTYYNDDGLHYEDGWDYPLVVDLAVYVSSYPASDLTPPLSKRPDGLGCNYVKLANFGDVIGDIMISFDGQDSYHWDANLILAKSGNDYTFTRIPLNEAEAGSLIVNEIENYEYIILNPAVKSWYASDLNYTYSAELLPWPDYSAQVEGNGTGEVYSLGMRTVSFHVINAGSEQDFYHMSVSDKMGWSVELHDTIYALPVKDTITVYVDVYGGAGLVPGTTDTVYLSARSHSDSTAVFTGGMPVEIVRHNGDANNDGLINVSDAVAIINYVFIGGDPPKPEPQQGDANCDEIVNVSDAVHIINYVFVSGPPPPCLPY